MKLSLALLTADALYGSRLKQRLEAAYSEKLEVSVFHDPETLLTALRQRVRNVLLLDGVPLPEADIPEGCIVARLTAEPPEEGEDAVAKYQRAEGLYRSVFALYARRGGGSYRGEKGDRQTALVLFASPAGGCGSSTAAAACGLYYARAGKRALYISGSLFGSDEDFFEGRKQGVSNVLEALKSTDAAARLPACMESAVSVTEEGLCCLGASETVRDLLDADAEDAGRFVKYLLSSRLYDLVILDVDFIPSPIFFTLMGQASSLVMTLDGTERSCRAASRGLQLLKSRDNREGTANYQKTTLLYSRYRSSQLVRLREDTLPVLGYAPRVEGAAGRQVAEQVSRAVDFQKLTSGEAEQYGG